MSNENESNEGEGIKNLREQFEKMQRQNAELLETLNVYQKRDRQATVAGILKNKGVPETAASLYEGEDTSEDAVGKWLDDQRQRAALFTGVTPSPANQQQDPTTASVQRIAEAMTGQLNPLSPPAPGAILGDPSEIEHAIKTLPYEKLVELGYMPKDDPRMLHKRSGR